MKDKQKIIEQGERIKKNLFKSLVISLIIALLPAIGIIAIITDNYCQISEIAIAMVCGMTIWTEFKDILKIIAEERAVNQKLDSLDKEEDK